MPYRLLIAVAAGLVSAVVFASATTGPLLIRMVLFLLTPLALFLAGLGLGPLAAAVAGLAGTLLVLVAGTPMGALVFAAAQAIPVAILIYLAQLNRPGRRQRQWYPAGRLDHRRRHHCRRLLIVDDDAARRRRRDATHSVCAGCLQRLVADEPRGATADPRAGGGMEAATAIAFGVAAGRLGH